MSVKKIVKKATEKLTGDSEENEPIENDQLDNNPPGSSSAINRGVPQNAAKENKQGGTTPRKQVFGGDDETKDAQIVKTMPYKKENPLSVARAGLRRSMASAAPTPRAASGEGKRLSPKAIAHLVKTIDGVDAATALELNSVLEVMGVDESNIREVRELMKNPQLFAGDQKPANLQVLGLPPGAQKPPTFDVVPGTTVVPDDIYYPTRFAMIPDEQYFQDGDLICHVHEDSTYFVLSVEQQKSEWQSQHHLPPMNIISRVGGSVDEAPEEIVKKGLTEEE